MKHIHKILIGLIVAAFIVVFLPKMVSKPPKAQLVTIYTPNDIYYLDINTNMVTSQSGKHSFSTKTLEEATDFLEIITAHDANQPAGRVYNDVDAIIGSLNGDREIDSVVYHYIHLYNITDSTLIREILNRYYL